ncbi:MAG: pilus assembly protein PilP [Thiohalomonadaceae bacterium]
MRLMTSAKHSSLLVPALVKIGLITTVLGLLTACSGGDMSDLQQYLRAEKAKPPGRIAPVPEFKSYEIVHYEANDLRDPFMRFEADAEIVATTTSGIPGPDLNRNRETLESFPLDTLRFVGHLSMDGQEWAIITSPDRMVHRVRAGNYVGTNFGKIVAVTENRLLIDEVVADGRGGWIEREAALSLIE